MGSLINSLSTISSIVGILTAVPVFWLWHDHIFGRRKRHKNWLQKAASSTGKLPAILIVDLIANADITAQVKHFKALSTNLKSVADEDIVTVSRERDLSPEDIPELAREIQNKVGEVLRRGTDELSVFIAGPVTIAAIVGAELSNVGCKVLLYQNDRASSTYVNFGPLRHPRF